MFSSEGSAGITFSEVGIDVSRCRGGGNCKVICPRCHHTHTNPTQRDTDLSVNLENGGWNCHRCGWKSGLTAERQNRDGWLAGRHMQGVKREAPKARQVTRELHTAAAAEAVTLPPTLEPQAVDWLRDRGISQAVADAYGLRSSGDTLHSPYYVNGALVNVKTRNMREKKGGFRQTPGSDRSLFGVDLAMGQTTLVIVEGEMDVLAVREAGWYAVSCPDGAPGTHTNPETGEVTVAAIGKKLDALNESTSVKALATAQQILIATDGDLEGQAMRDGLLEVLDPMKCWLVTWPQGCKDANDVLAKYGADKLDDVLGSARPVDVPGITDFHTERDALYGIWSNGHDPGVETGWPELDEIWRPRRGTLNLVTGIPGMGKTSFMLDMLSRLALNHGWKGAIFSPESGDTGTLYAKLVQIATDSAILPSSDFHMKRELLEAGADWVDAHFCRIDAAPTGDNAYGAVTLEELVKRIETAVLRRGISWVYLDPWNRIGSESGGDTGDTTYIGKAINTLHTLAIRHNLFMVTVAHPHKMSDEEAMPSAYNIAGSAHWFNMGDVIVGVQRNKEKEPRNRTTVKVLKHRFEGHSGKLGEAYFWLDARSGRFYTDQNQIPMTTGTQSWVTPTFTKAEVQVEAAPWEAA